MKLIGKSTFIGTAFLLFSYSAFASIVCIGSYMSPSGPRKTTVNIPLEQGYVPEVNIDGVDISSGAGISQACKAVSMVVNGKGSTLISCEAVPSKTSFQTILVVDSDSRSAQYTTVAGNNQITEALKLSCQ